jgi:phosphoglycerate kinase
MSTKLGKTVRLVKDYLGPGPESGRGRGGACWRTCVSTRVRRRTNEELASKYAALCDVFVMDAFGTAHRAQASTHGAGKFAPVACAGLLLAEELDALNKALANPARPMVAIVGGSKVSTKLTVLEALSKKWTRW